jgi:hypothetical protein
MPDFRVALVRASLVRPTQRLMEIVERTLAPLVSRAGKTLILSRPDTASAAELQIHFVSRADSPVRMGEQFIGQGPVRLIFGDEGGGNVFVGAMEELRVGGVAQAPQTGPLASRGLARDYAATVQSVFRNGEPAFAQFAANVAIHEMGHIIAALPHSSAFSNYMATGQSVPAGDARTLAGMRSFWAGAKSFDAAQVARLVPRIASGNFAGGMRVGPP